MDVNTNINEEANEKKRFPFFKLLLGIIAVAAIIFGAVAVERNIDKTVRDVNVNKSALSSEKVTYFSVKPLNTRIMAVKASDGTVRLAFEECLSCYYNNGVKSKYADKNGSVVCSNCGCVTYYDDMGVLSYECTPYPILSDYIIEDDHTITVPKDFLEECLNMLEVLRSGKGNYASVYPESEYMNMEITEGGDRAVQYDTSGDNFVPEQPVTAESLSNKAEAIAKLYNGYLDSVTLYSSTEDIAAYDELYKEFTGLCDELYDTEVNAERAAEINGRFGEIEDKLGEIGRAAAAKAEQAQ